MSKTKPTLIDVLYNSISFEQLWADEPAEQPATKQVEDDKGDIVDDLDCYYRFTGVRNQWSIKTFYPHQINPPFGTFDAFFINRPYTGVAVHCDGVFTYYSLFKYRFHAQLVAKASKGVYALFSGLETIGSGVLMALGFDKMERDYFKDRDN